MSRGLQRAIQPHGSKDYRKLVQQFKKLSTLSLDGVCMVYTKRLVVNKQALKLGEASIVTGPN